MNMSDWIALAAAVGTLALAIAAFVQVRQGRLLASSAFEDRLARVRPSLRLEIDPALDGREVVLTFRNVGVGPAVAIEGVTYAFREEVPYPGARDYAWTAEPIMLRRTVLLATEAMQAHVKYPFPLGAGTGRQDDLENFRVAVRYDDMERNQYVSVLKYKVSAAGFEPLEEIGLRLAFTARAGELSVPETVKRAQRLYRVGLQMPDVPPKPPRLVLPMGPPDESGTGG